MDKISKLDSLEKQRSAIKEQLDSWTTERTIEFKLLSVDKEILDVAIDICNVEHYLDKTSWDSHEKERFGSKEYLRKEKEQLRKEKEQLRKEKERLRKEKEQLREQQNILMLAASRNINGIIL